MHTGAVQTPYADYYTGASRVTNPIRGSGPAVFQKIMGRVGSGRVDSGQEVFNLLRIGSGHASPTRPDPT